MQAAPGVSSHTAVIAIWPAMQVKTTKLIAANPKTRLFIPDQAPSPDPCHGRRGPAAVASLPFVAYAAPNLYPGVGRLQCAARIGRWGVGCVESGGHGNCR